MAKKKSTVKGPRPVTITSLDKRMTVEKEIVDELLLVCGVIGTTAGSGEELVPVTDCLNWLQDLQRALRRDDDSFRPISLLMGKWKVVEQKLLPLVLTCRYDVSIVLTVVKILVILTKPLSEPTKRAGRMVIESANKANAGVVAEKIKLRENALQQAELLLEYKRMFVHHPSHLSSAPGEGLMSVFVSLLAEPLSRSGASRTETDHLTIELVLHLFRNLLSIDVLLKSSSDSARRSSELHDSLISLFDKELVLEILLVLGQNLEARENAQYNLLLMELLHHIIKTQDPALIVEAASGQKPSKRSLLLDLKKPKTSQAAAARHSHFGGTWRAQESDGRVVYTAAGDGRQGKPQGTEIVRKSRSNEPFIGTSGTALTSRITKSETPVSLRAKSSLHKFCERFIEDCYGPTMKSLKNEFRRDSVRLEEGDKVIFFRVIWFFSQWWRLSQKAEALGPLIFTMDVFTFNLVLTATDTFQQHKKYSRLAQSVALYSEMTNLLYIMFKSKDKTENLMARGLIDRLFYGSEPLDRLPKLLRSWIPGVTTRSYLCDLVELSHMSLKILDTNFKDSMNTIDLEDKNQSHGKVAEMQSNASKFHVPTYFLRKIATAQTINLYIQLLGHYSQNSKLVNHRLVSMLLRISKTELMAGEIADSSAPLNPLGRRQVMYEPILFDLQLVMIAEKILNDASLRHRDDASFLIKFCTGFLSRFQDATIDNPALFVDCLFRHAASQRFCEQVENKYVTDELRMLAERDILLKESMQYAVEEDGDSDGELVMETFPTENTAVSDEDDGSDVVAKAATENAAVSDEDDNSGIVAKEQTENEDPSQTSGQKRKIVEEGETDIAPSDSKRLQVLQ